MNHDEENQTGNLVFGIAPQSDRPELGTREFNCFHVPPTLTITSNNDNNNISNDVKYYFSLEISDEMMIKYYWCKS